MKKEMVDHVDSALAGIDHGSVTLRIFVRDSGVYRYEVEQVVSHMADEKIEPVSAPVKPSGLLNVRQAAEYLNIAEITLRRAVRAGTVKFVRIGSRILFKSSDLESM